MILHCDYEDKMEINLSECDSSVFQTEDLEYNISAHQKQLNKK
jgi:hypothetical protein